MTATEELRRMLDECGVDYRVSATGYSIDIGPYTTAYANRSDTTLDVSLRQVTPEQAIAATLGNGEYERKMDALLCRLTNGKFSKTRAYDLDFMESVVREEFETDAATLGDADLAAENAKLRELLQRLLAEYRYMSVRPRKVYMQHERRMRFIEEEMRELGIEVEV
jgi:hypothetical protein